MSQGETTHGCLAAMEAGSLYKPGGQAAGEGLPSEPWDPRAHAASGAFGKTLP